MNSTARHSVGGVILAGWSYVKGGLFVLGDAGGSVLSCEAGWGDAITEACLAWLDSLGSQGVPVAAWPEGALCDPVKMVFTDPS
jgi:hypothetical protein